MRVATTLLLALLVTSIGCLRPQIGEWKRFEYSEPQMGVPFRIILYAASASQADEAAEAAFKSVGELNTLFSDYESDSELSRISFSSDTNGPPVRVSSEMFQILSRSQKLARQTDGAFDVTIGPVVHLWRKARREKMFPRADYLADARARVGHENLQLSARNQTAHLTKERMRLDLGGIAKGYAVDQALEALRSHGIKRAFVAASGDVAVSGPPPGASSWVVELTELDPNAEPIKVKLAHAAVTTSGDLNQKVELGGVVYSHIVDPRTGIGLTNRTLVTTIGPDCTTADSLATAISVMGPVAGAALLESYRGVEARVSWPVDGEIRTMETPGFSRFKAD